MARPYVERRLGVRQLLCAALLTACIASIASPGKAQSDEDETEATAEVAPGMPWLVDPFGTQIRVHFYEQLRRAPWKALLLDLALPGAGSVYTELYGHAITAATLSLAGAGLWIAGAAKDHDGLWWAGAGTFAAGRLYGVVSAPLGASLLNAAYRKQLGLVRKPR